MNDHRWHHITVTFPGSGWFGDGVRFCVDGQEYGPATHVYDTIRTEAGGDQRNVGGRKGSSDFEGWTGAFDDFAIWASALTQPMLSAIGSCASTLTYDASGMEALFTLFRNERGSTAVQQRIWQYEMGLNGTIDTCVPSAATGAYTVVLDAGGGGVVGHPQ